LLDLESWCIQDANPALGALLRVPRDSLRGVPFSSLFVNPEDGARLKESLSAEDTSVREVLLRRGEDSFIAQLSVSLLAPGLPLVRVLVLDLSSRALLDEEQLQSQKMETIGHLSATVAHDVNNLLMVISNAGDALRRAVLPMYLQATVQDLLSAAQRGAEIVSQIRDLARRAPATHETFDLCALVRNHGKMLQWVIPPRISVSVSVPPRPLYVYGNESQWSQVLLNLCINARDAMLQGGELTLALRETPKRRAMLSVRDTGQGMSEEVRLRAAEPYFTTKPGGRGLGRGSGLGLSVVYTVAREHHATLSIQSEPGKGSTFQIEIPTERAPQESTVQTPRSSPSNSGQSPCRILLVDDEELLRRSMTRLLKISGYTVTVASSVAEATAILGDDYQRFDVILCDFLMPDEDGSVLAERVLRRGERRPFFVLMSGHPDEQRPHLERLGVHGILLKPFRVEELNAFLSTLLREDEP
jgi:signal transduction histidine kinase